ncbi:hypothetical protein LY76DRAFT_413309 [Colletotrichum caudatum]|nr:hypothetical protein LY76DRAFT_413309 [Colletotrichum caudatum]
MLSAVLKVAALAAAARISRSRRCRIQSPTSQVQSRLRRTTVSHSASSRGIHPPHAHHTLPSSTQTKANHAPYHTHKHQRPPPISATPHIIKST